MASNILSSRDTNAQVNQQSTSPAKQSKPKSLEYHRQMLASRLKEDPAPKFVSPSDEIMSPATQKLKDFRGKHALKKNKPQTLFKKTSTKNFEKGAPMFADIPKGVPQEAQEDEKMGEA